MLVSVGGWLLEEWFGARAVVSSEVAFVEERRRGCGIERRRSGRGGGGREETELQHGGDSAGFENMICFSGSSRHHRRH